MALGAVEGVGSLMIPSDSSLASLLPSTHAAPERHQPIEIKRLDTALGDFDISTSANVALKVDVQGYEQSVLAGATETLDPCQGHSDRSLFEADLRWRAKLPRHSKSAT